MMQKEGGTNQFVDLSILHHSLCSLVRLKAVNHTFQENLWSCQCAQYSPCNSISGLNIWDMIRYKSYDLSLTLPSSMDKLSMFSHGIKAKSTTRLQIMWSSHWHFVSKFNHSLTIPPPPLPLPLSICLWSCLHHCSHHCPLPFMSPRYVPPPPIHLHSWMGLS